MLAPVRRAPDSRGGSLKMWTLQPGARLEISSPSSLFDIDWGRRNYALNALDPAAWREELCGALAGADLTAADRAAHPGIPDGPVCGRPPVG